MQDRPATRRPQDLAAFIDHTILKPDAREADIARFCEEAITHRFRAVCVNGVHAALVARMLAGSDSVACVVVGFPLGAASSAIKAAEAAAAVEAGAAEIDMVIAIGALKDGNRHGVRDDIAAVRRACGPALLKTIIEACLLTDEEKAIACHLAREAGADFVKTSTGFAASGATAADVALMRRTLDAAGVTSMGVKASGGIRSAAAAIAMIEAGASRIGTSSGIAIVADSEATTGSY